MALHAEPAAGGLLRPRVGHCLPGAPRHTAHYPSHVQPPRTCPGTCMPAQGQEQYYRDAQMSFWAGQSCYRAGPCQRMQVHMEVRPWKTLAEGGPLTRAGRGAAAGGPERERDGGAARGAEPGVRAAPGGAALPPAAVQAARQRGDLAGRAAPAHQPRAVRLRCARAALPCTCLCCGPCHACQGCALRPAVEVHVLAKMSLC